MLQSLILLEENILLWIQENMRNDMLTPIFTFITALGSGGFIWLILSFVLLIPQKTRLIGLMSIMAIVLSVLVNNVVLKNVIARTRPYEIIEGLTTLVGAQRDYSFPSGHTGCSFAAAVVMFRGLPKKYGIPILLLAFLIAFSRLYVGVHYPSDVLCGALISTGIALLVYWRGTCQQSKKGMIEGENHEE